MDFLLEKDILVDPEKPDELGKPLLTFAFNLAIYLILEDYNEHYPNNPLGVIPENKVGRGGFSDALIVSSDSKIMFLEIEHENNNRFEKLQENIDKLVNSQARQQIIITYESEAGKITKDKILKNLIVKKDMWIIIGTDELENGGEDFSLHKLTPNIRR